MVLLPVFLLVLQEGILPPWQSKAFLEDAQKQTMALTEVLARLDTGHWKGDYTPVLERTRQRMISVANALYEMSSKPESLSLGLEAFLSLEHLETNFDSLARGAERFQPTAAADLDKSSGELIKLREKFQTYLLDLSKYLEKNVTVSTRDLESCRDQLWKRPPPSPSGPRRR